MNLRDGVKNADLKVSSETSKLSDIVKDASVPLSKRLKSFNEIIYLEVGETAITRAKALEREFDIRKLYIKFEGDNPTGTQKDRIAFAQVYDALKNGFETIITATCGNYGVALALAAELAGINCHIAIPESYHTERAKEMESVGAKIHRLPGTYEEVVKLSSIMALDRGWYDANPGGKNTQLQIMAYSQIAAEIVKDLGEAPSYCAIPVSNGTLLAGIHHGFMQLKKENLINKIPKIIAASSTQKNPIIQSFVSGLAECIDLDPNKIKETKYNEPLINWHSFDGDEALQAIRESQGFAFNVSDSKLKTMSSLLLKKEGLKILPASTAGLIGLLETYNKYELSNDIYVAIVTAKD